MTTLFVVRIAPGNSRRLQRAPERAEARSPTGQESGGATGERGPKVPAGLVGKPIGGRLPNVKMPKVRPAQ